MKPILRAMCLFATALLLLPAGCPPSVSDSADTLQSGFPTPGTGSPVSVTPSGTSGDSNSSATSTVPAVVNGDSSTTSITDALTTRLPGCEEPIDADAWRAEILRLVNEERQSRGIGTLTWSQTLEDEATQYACEMVYYGFFGHVNPATSSTLTDRTAEFSYDFWIIGENLAAGQRTPAQAMSDWMNSPCHRENILNPAFTELGVGVRSGGGYGLYWVQEFGRPFSTAPFAGPLYMDPECTHTE